MKRRRSGGSYGLLWSLGRTQFSCPSRVLRDQWTKHLRAALRTHSKDTYTSTTALHFHFSFVKEEVCKSNQTVLAGKLIKSSMKVLIHHFVVEQVDLGQQEQVWLTKLNLINFKMDCYAMPKSLIRRWNRLSMDFTCWWLNWRKNTEQEQSGTEDSCLAEHQQEKKNTESKQTRSTSGLSLPNSSWFLLYNYKQNLYLWRLLMQQWFSD